MPLYIIFDDFFLKIYLSSFLIEYLIIELDILSENIWGDQATL